METVYLRDQLPRPPIIMEGQNWSVFIMIASTLVLFLAFWAWLLWTVNANTIQYAATGGQLLLSCQPGECGTNLQSGAKRCPTGATEVVLIDPAAEVCNPKYSCTNPLTPYALLADGSTNELGACSAGATCRCLKTAQCASHITSIFTTVNGSLYNQAPDNRFVFSQVPLRDDIGATNVGYQSSATDFCGIKSNHLNRLSPGACTFVDSDYANVKGTLKIATDCINTNPCVVGTLAFNTTNPAQLEANGVSLKEVRSLPVACIKGSPVAPVTNLPYPDSKCPTGYVPYWDNRWGLLRCAEIKYVTV